MNFARDLEGAVVRGHDIFVSYSREDRSAAERISARLENEGFSVWWDAAIHSGETFDEVIEKQLRAAKAAVILWSPRSVASRWVRAEATLADRRGILCPVLIEACDLPILFELTHTTDLSTWNGDRDAPVWQRLVGDIRHLVDPPLSAHPAPAAPAKGFLLADDAPVHPQPSPRVEPASRAAEPSLAAIARAQVPAPAAPSTPAPVRAAPVEPDPGSETEQTAFYTKADTEQRLHGSEVHCLEVGPEDAPLARHPVGLLGAKIGRAAPAEIILSDKRISRKHCSIELTAGELVVTDLHSTNGTFIDGERIEEPTVLPAQSELKVGDIVLTHRVRAFAELD